MKRKSQVLAIVLPVASMTLLSLNHKMLARPAVPSQPAASKLIVRADEDKPKVSSTYKMVRNGIIDRTKIKEIVAGVDGHVSTGRMASMDAQVNGRKVLVSAQARISDIEPGYVYAWSMRVRDRDTYELVAEHFYTDQIFVFHAQDNVNVMWPEFVEEFALPPGDYAVDVAIDRVKAGFDFSKVEPGEIPQNASRAAGVKKISIAK